MIKYIVTSIIASIAVISSAQTPDIQVHHFIECQYIGSVPSVDLYTHDFANAVVEITPTGLPLMKVDLLMINESVDSVHWIVSRTRIAVDTSWNDELCWGPYDAPFGGQCITAESMDTNYWEGPCTGTYIFDGAAGDTATLNVHVWPNLNQSGCGTYRYYVGTCAEPYLDSVDISICFSVGINELSEAGLNVNISPNPAKESFRITTASNEIVHYLIYNAAGQKMSSGSFTNEEVIDAGKLENGMYFVQIQSTNGRETIEKFIINK